MPRAGIVHRLDKDTTGLMVVAKTVAAHKTLVEALQAGQIADLFERVGGFPAIPLMEDVAFSRACGVITLGRR